MARSKRGRYGKSESRGSSTKQEVESRGSDYKGSGEHNNNDRSSVSKEESEVSKDLKSKGGTANDPSWYSRDPALLFSAANIPFSEPSGTDFGMHDASGNALVSFTNGGKYRALPGVLTLTIKPSIGHNTDRNSPINVAAQAFYTHVRYVNSGRKNYDQADLMMYALAISDIYSYVMMMQRAYALAFMYSQRNYYVGKNLLQAAGIDPDAIISNLANFRYRLNAFINKISTFAVPADIALFNRRAFMYAGIYTESPDGFIKDQLYLFKPHGFYKYDRDSGGKGMLDYVPLSYSNNDLLTVDELFAVGEDMLANIYGDEDFGLMAGDIIKAYGSNIIGLVEIPETYNIIPMYDEYVLSQFRNAQVVPSYVTKTKEQIGTDVASPYAWDAPHNASAIAPIGAICQNEVGDIVSAEAIVSTAASTMKQAGTLYDFPALVDIHRTVPTPEDVIEATRLKVRGFKVDSVTVDSDTYQRLFLDCGTEIVTQCTMYYLQYTADGTRTLETSHFYYTAAANQVNLELLRVFQHAPIMLIALNMTSAGTTIGDPRFVGNMVNPTRIDGPQLSRMHEVALLSLLYVPGIAKIGSM